MKTFPVIAFALLLFSSCKKSDNAPQSQPAVVTNPTVKPNTYTILLDFDRTDGGGAEGSLIQVGNVLYGMTVQGGASLEGNIFSINPDGTGFRGLHEFTGNSSDGGGPQGALTLYGNLLYGATVSGGLYGQGIVFSIAPDGSGYKVLYNFGATNLNGEGPCGSVVISNGVMYGMTRGGGAHSNDGLIYAVDTDGTGFTDLFDFDGTDGSFPYSSLIVSGNTLYGMTYTGGTDNDGVVFSIGTNGSGYSLLVNFDAANGEQPPGTLLLSGNTLYGMTYGGGANNEGLIFSVDTNGSNYTDLLDFDRTNGRYPYGSLVISGTTLYGMTWMGGESDEGTIFSIGTNGNRYQKLHDFINAGGQSPYGSLLLSGNMLYGMTLGGGTSNYGVIFSYSL